MKFIYKDKYPRWLRPILEKVIGYRANDIKKTVKLDKSDVGVYSLDYTLAHLIAPSLEQLRNTDFGFAMVDDEDVPESMSPYDSANNDQDDLGRDRWNYVLDKMIFSFSHIADESWGDEFHTGEIDHIYERVEGQPFVEVKKGPNHTHKFDGEGYKKKLDKIQEGLNLFGKYYMNLWW